MKYFELSRSSEPKITGIKDGTTQSYLSTQFLMINPIIQEYVIANPEKYLKGIIPKENKPMTALPLCKGAKLTDFISVGGLLRGLVINQKVRDILEVSNLPNHRFYPVTFVYEDNKGTYLTGYYWFIYELERGENVNFQESVFEISDEDRNKQAWLKTFDIRSNEDYNKVADALGTAPLASKLVLNQSFNNDLDIWGTYRFANSKYVSERLAEKFKKGNLTNYKLVNPTKNYLMPIIPPCELIFK
jgi:hypothetical protein